MSKHNETIKCPKCGCVQIAEVLHTFPWYSYVHTCTSCGYIITESEWIEVKPCVNAICQEIAEIPNDEF